MLVADGQSPVVIDFFKIGDCSFQALLKLLILLRHPEYQRQLEVAEPGAPEALVALEALQSLFQSFDRLREVHRAFSFVRIGMLVVHSAGLLQLLTEGQDSKHVALEEERAFLYPLVRLLNQPLHILPPVQQDQIHGVEHNQLFIQIHLLVCGPHVL